MRVVHWDTLRCAVHCTFILHMQKEGEGEKRVRGPISINRPLPLLLLVQDITCSLGVEKKKTKTKTLKPYHFDFTHLRTERHMRKRGPCARLRSSPKQTELHAFYHSRTSEKRRAHGVNWKKKEKTTTKENSVVGQNETQRVKLQ